MKYIWAMRPVKYNTIYIIIYIYIQFLTFSRSHAVTIMLSFFFWLIFFVTIMLSFSRSLCSLRFSLLKTKNIYHYALIFFFHFTYFFSQSQLHYSTTFFFIIISLCSHFFFNLAYFFSQSQSFLFNNFFFIMLSLCSHESIFFIFSFFVSVKGRTLCDFLFFPLNTNSGKFKNSGKSKNISH